MSRRDLTFPTPAHVKRHQQVKIRIGVARKGQRRKASVPDDDSHFLQQLSYQRFLGRLAGLHLAAWEFPKARHRFSGGALRNENAAVGIDEGAGCDDKKRSAHDRMFTLGGLSLRND